MNAPEAYIAGPLFTPGERQYLEQIDQICRASAFSTYLPHRDAGIAPANGSVTEPFFRQDLAMLRDCRIIVAVLNGTDVDAGTAWELGYAYALSKKAIGIYEDTRIADPLSGMNLMITSSMRIVSSQEGLRLELEQARRALNSA